MSDAVATAIVGGVVTLGGSIIAGLFGMWKIYVLAKAASAEAYEAKVVAKESIQIADKNTVAIEKVENKTNQLHDALTEFNKETGLGRKAAEEKLQQLRTND